MVAVILGNGHNNSGFSGLSYAVGKEELGKGELMKMNNFPPHLTKKSKDVELRNHLIMTSSRGKGNRKPIKNPQLHVVISSEGFKDSKEQLTNVAEKWLKEMGYSEQPYVIVNHNDSANNHVHIITSRVDVSNGKKINDSNEKYKSIDALNRILGRTKKIKEEQKLLAYKYKTLGQVKIVLDKNKIKHSEKEGKIMFMMGGKDYIFDKDSLAQTKENVKRKIQIKAIMHNYKGKLDNDVFKIEGKKGLEYNSQLIQSLKNKFGLEIVFHTKEDKEPFGYSLIDHKSKEVYKGSEIMKMKEFCNFTDNRITKDYYDELMLFKYDSISTAKELLKHKDFMLSMVDVEKHLKAKAHLKEWKNYDNCNSFCKEHNCSILNKNGRTIINNHYSKEVTDVTFDKDFKGLDYFKENNTHQKEEIFYEYEPISSKKNYELEGLVNDFTNVLYDDSTDLPIKKKKKRKIQR